MHALIPRLGLFQHDPSTIPYDLLEFHLQGGGRQAAKKVKKQLQDKRKEEALEKADTVRASGHGLDSVATSTSRQSCSVGTSAAGFARAALSARKMSLTDVPTNG